MTIKALRSASALALLLGLGFANAAHAQEAKADSPQSEPTAPQDTRRDVVIVTAQKRAESVQDIGMAVTAVNSETREEIGLNTLTDFTNFAPGLTFSVGNDRIGMRGVNRNTNNFGIRTGVSNYVDGVYVPSSIVATASRRPIMVDRTEVVRGPQGTLYGRDSIGGALNIISKRPTKDFHTELNVGAGSFDTNVLDLSVSGPITDYLRYRVVGTREKQGEGFLKNASGGESEGLRNDAYNYEFQLAGEIGESINWFARAGHIYWQKAGAPGARTSAGDRQPYDTRLFAVGANALAPNSAYGYIAPSYTQVGSFIGNPTVNDPYSFNTDTKGVATLTGGDDGALEVIWNGPGFDVKYLGGYSFYKYNFLADNDASPVTSFQARIYPFSPAGTLTTVRPGRTTEYNEQRATFSNEVNFISTWDGPLQAIAGLYQYQENFDQPIYVWYNNAPISPTSNRVLVNPATGAVTGIAPTATPTRFGNAVSTYTSNGGISDSYGIFTQVDWTFNDAFKLTGGLRYSKDYSWIEERGRVMCYYTSTCQAAGATAASPGADATDQAFYGAQLSLYPNGSPGVLNTSAANPSGATTDPLTGNRIRHMADSWSAVTGMARLDWTPTKDTLVFLNYARGYKGGGFNASSFAPIPEVNPEHINSYELGWKQDIPQYFLTVNTDLYYYDYKGYQVPNTVIPLPVGTAAAVPYTAFVNLPKIETTGIEIETTWAPTEAFRLLLNYGFTNPEIKEATGLVDSTDPLARLPGAKPTGTIVGARYDASGNLVDGQVGQDVSGNITPFTPKNKVSVNAIYTFDLQNWGSLTASASYSWQDATYSSIFNRYTNRTPSWDLTNFRLLWNSSDRHFSVIGFINNIFDGVQYDGRTSALRRADAVAASATQGGAVSATTTARTIPQTMNYCATSAATTINPLGNNGNGSLAESCITYSEQYRMPRWGGIELQFHF